MRKTIITSSNHMQFLRQELLQKQSVLTGIHILPFKASFFASQDHQDIEFIKDYQKLQSLKLNKLSQLVKFPKILSEFKNLAEMLLCYGLTLDDLPSDNIYDQDIKRVMEALLHDLKKPDENTVYLDEGLKHHEKVFLKRHQVKTFEIETETTPAKLEYKTALNFRQELEGAIQYILNKHLEDVSLVIPNKSSNAPFVISALKRYGLDLENDFNFDLTKKQYIALLNYIETPSKDNIISILESNVLKLKETENIIFFIEHFKMSHEDILTSFILVEDNGLRIAKEITEIQSKIQEDVSTLQTTLTHLNSLKLDEKLIYALDIIKDIHPQGASKISNYLQNTIQFINHNNLNVIRYQIENLSDNTLSHHKIKIYDLETLPITPVEHMIVLGLTAKTFPGISAKTGILDEAYLSRIHNFPSQTTRNNASLLEKYKIFKKAKHLILSHHAINFEGKAQETSFPVETFVKDYGIQRSSAWHIIESNPFMEETYQLKSDTAHKLYLNDGILNASVSSLEKYISDPYQYFLEEGLKLRRPFDFGFDGRIIGTFNHEVVENALSKTNTNYQSIWEKYQPYFSKKDHMISLLIEFNKETMIPHIEHLLQLQNQSQFKVASQEQRIFDTETFEGISMRGFIDRIDLAEDDTFMIIDYKSSKHSLSPAKVQRGEQLQLLTYAIVLSKTFKSNLFGVYYYALDRKKTDEKTNRYLQSRGIVKDTTAMDEESFRENFVYEGWTFLDEDDYGIDKKYFKSSRSGKQFKEDKNFSLDNIESFMKLMLQKIKRNILNGILDINQLQQEFETNPIINDNGVWREKHE